jgi:hypothetical protein
MTSWIQALVGVIFLAGGGLAIWILLTDRFEDDSAWKRIFGIGISGGVVAAGVWLAWPLFLLLVDLFRGGSTAQELVAAREEARSAVAAQEADGFSRGMYAAGIFNGLAAPFLACSILRENPHSIRGWFVLLAVPIGCVLALPVLTRLLGISIPEASVLEWLVNSASYSDGLGVVTFGLFVETIWLAIIYTNHVSAIPIGPIAAALTPLSLLPGQVALYRDAHWAIEALLWVTCVLLGIVTNEVRKLENEGERRKRDQRAQQFQNALLQLSEGAACPRFALYLRPFCATGSLDTQGKIGETEALDLETVLAKTLAPQSRLLALGRASEADIIGADRLYLPDTGWWPTVEKLGSLAANVFVLPSHRQGTLQEIRWLAEQGHLTKCVFVMPETPSGRGLQFAVKIPKTVTITADREIDHAPSWRIAAEAVNKETGVRLPAYDPRGAVFTVHADGSVRAAHPLDLSRTLFRVGRLRKAIRAVSDS